MRRDSKKRTATYTIDLHGFTVHFGWMRLKDQLEQAKLDKHKVVRIIYGHGKMKNEILRWLEAMPVRSIQQSKDGGSLTLRLL